MERASEIILSFINSPNKIWFTRKPLLSPQLTGMTSILVVVVSNILFWFVGCAILSLGVWMRFIEGPIKDYFLQYPQAQF